MAESKKVGEKKWIIEVQENGTTKELFIEIPEDAINQVGWHDGDILEWTSNGDGTWSIQKKH